MKHLRLGFDCDGVLSDFSKCYLEWAAEMWPDFKPLPEWDFGLTKSQQDVLWAEIKATENFWLKLEAIGTSKLREADSKHTLIFVTSRVPSAGASIERQTAMWLNWKFDVLWPTVIVVNHWHEKPALFRDLRLDAFIDDKQETVLAMLRKGQDAYVFDQPWNREENFPNRVKSIEEYISSVEAKLGSG